MDGDFLKPVLTRNTLMNSPYRKAPDFDGNQELDQIDVGLSKFKTELQKVKKITAIKPKEEHE